MPIIRYALVAAAASMMAAAATAQPYSSPSTDQMPSASNPPDTRDATDAASADTNGPPAARAAVGTETSAVVNGQTVQVISSQPVPDTPENRAKYGQPLSRAGKRTKPIGN